LLIISVYFNYLRKELLLTSNKFKHLFIIPENVDIALLSVAVVCVWLLFVYMVLS